MNAEAALPTISTIISGDGQVGIIGNVLYDQLQPNQMSNVDDQLDVPGISFSVQCSLLPSSSVTGYAINNSNGEMWQTWPIETPIQDVVLYAFCKLHASLIEQLFIVRTYRSQFDTVHTGFTTATRIQCKFSEFIPHIAVWSPFLMLRTRWISQEFSCLLLWI